MDYIQENITDCQTTIMEIEVIGCPVICSRLFGSYSDPVRPQLRHFALMKGQRSKRQLSIFLTAFHRPDQYLVDNSLFLLGQSRSPLGSHSLNKLDLLESTLTVSRAEATTHSRLTRSTFGCSAHTRSPLGSHSLNELDLLESTLTVSQAVATTHSLLTRSTFGCSAHTRSSLGRHSASCGPMHVYFRCVQEQGDDTTQVKDFISSSTPTEARILLESFLAKVIELVSPAVLFTSSYLGSRGSSFSEVWGRSSASPPAPRRP